MGPGTIDEQSGGANFNLIVACVALDGDTRWERDSQHVANTPPKTGGRFGKHDRAQHTEATEFESGPK